MGENSGRPGGPGRGQPKEVLATTKSKGKGGDQDTTLIEYLIHQSTLGVHFMFDSRDVTRVLRTPTDEQAFFTIENMGRVQELLTTFLEKKTIAEKERFVDNLPEDKRDLLIRAYFHLVENTIQTNFDLKH
jgi:hypothetical protein